MKKQKRRPVRVTLDLTFELTEITNAARQNRLLKAILENDEVLNEILLNTSVDGLFEFPEAPSEYAMEAAAEILAPVLDAIPEADKTFFQQCIDKGLLLENTKQIWSAFQPVGMEASSEVLEGDE